MTDKISRMKAKSWQESWQIDGNLWVFRGVCRQGENVK